MRILIGLLLCTFLLVPLACGGGGGDASGKKTYKIALIPKGTTHSFWRSVEAGARKAAAEYNAADDFSVEISWKGPLQEDNTEDQISLVKTYVSMGFDGLCVAPLDKGALVDPIREFGRSGVPVLVFDSGLDAEVGKDFISYVATDNYKGGSLGATRLAEVLGNKGRVLLLRYQPGSDSTMERERGFLETMKKSFPQIELVSTDQYAGATEEKAFEKSLNLLTRLTGQIEGIFCPNESSAAGMLDALQQRGLAGKVRFVGFDSSDKLVDGLKKKHLDGLVLQDPVKMGYASVTTMIKKLRGDTVEGRFDTGCTVATPDNMDTPEMKELHSPDLSKWLGK